MNKIIPFNKDITFKGNIKEIVSIALDNDLALKGENKVVGNFYIKGEYREDNEALTLEKYSYKIPVEIEISDKYDTYNATIDIDDFMYEVNKNILGVNIKVKLDNIEKKENINIINNDDLNDERVTVDKGIDNKNNKKDLKEVEKEEQEEIIDKLDDEMNERIEQEAFIDKKGISNDKKKDFSLLDKNSLNEKEDKYLTYFVYKVKEEDTINYIKEKYKVSGEDLSDYNDLEKFAPGVKLIIPSNRK